MNSSNSNKCRACGHIVNEPYRICYACLKRDNARLFEEMRELEEDEE